MSPEACFSSEPELHISVHTCVQAKTASLLSTVKESLMYDTLFTTNADTYRVQQRHTQFSLFSVSHFTSIALFKTQVRCLAVNYLHRQRPSKAAS